MSNIKRFDRKGSDAPVARNRNDAMPELESQFIMRLPPTPSAALRAALRSGVMNIKDRLSITLEPDNRQGIVRYERWYLPCRVVDLPCIIESHKTLDGKTFYKTADVAQMMIAYEEDDVPKSDDDSPKKTKDRKNMQDKKYQYPHGITAPLKNVRKRRFRKTLKKKYVDFPEIEKEVKRLFRQDNEAIAIRYEVVSAEEEKEGKSSSAGPVEVTGHIGPSATAAVPGEHDLFGEVLSSSDEETSFQEESEMRSSQAKAENDFFMSDFSQRSAPETAPTEEPEPVVDQEEQEEEDYSCDANESAARALEENYGTDESSSNNALLERLTQLHMEIAEIQERRQVQENRILAIENQMLKQRFQSALQELREEESKKQREYNSIVSMLNQH